MADPKFNPAVFREYDIRGIAGSELTPELAKRLGWAYARLVPAGATVAVGRDCRLSNNLLAEPLIEGLLASGINVLSIGVVPTPLTYFAIHALGLAGGIMVTGSHNPSEYNGFKIGVGKATLHGSQIQELRVAIEAAEPPATKRGWLETRDVSDLYIEHIQKTTGPYRPLKVVLDAGNGTAARLAPQLFRKLGAEVIELYCEMDGRFPNHHPDPTVPENLRELSETVRRTGAAFGVGFDGDSDRIGIVDETGAIWFGDQILTLLARGVLETNPGATIISEVKSSHRLYNDIRAHGGNALMWKTGHSLIKAKMKETGALLAGEMSGHIFFADRYFGYDDAIYAAARLYELASRSSKPFSALLDGYPPAVATPEIRVDCPDDIKFRVVNAVTRILSERHTVNPLDGARVEFPDGWGLVRASNTQPVLVLRFEALTSARMNEIRKLVESALAQARQEVGGAS